MGVFPINATTMALVCFSSAITSVAETVANSDEPLSTKQTKATEGPGLLLLGTAQRPPSLLHTTNRSCKVGIRCGPQNLSTNFSSAVLHRRVVSHVFKVSFDSAKWSLRVVGRAVGVCRGVRDRQGREEEEGEERERGRRWVVQTMMQGVRNDTMAWHTKKRRRQEEKEKRERKEREKRENEEEEEDDGRLGVRHMQV
ncbi:hypothetical protein MRB53_018823 [Persea americana]|uniref:Uncharacterized protein n=1 Tax=Persea americana TaxID=3435 RepID=A0ACC2M8U6_PERAE|nr:hypothetical protein MRB53_018823 [Persea americana]